MRRRAAGPVALWAGTVILHEEGTRGFWWLAAWWGLDGLRARLLWAGGLLGGGLVVAGVTAARRRHGALALGAWLTALTAATAAWLALATAPAEVVHLLQYALLVALLAGHGSGRAALIGLALGAADELYQWLVLYPDRGMDLPDVGLNAAGVLLGSAWAWSNAAKIQGPTPASRP